MFLFPAMDVENQNCSGDFFHLGRRNQKTTNTKTNTYRNTKTNTNYFFHLGRRNQKNTNTKTKTNRNTKTNTNYFFTWDGGTRRLSCTREFLVYKEDRVEETLFDENEDKERHFCYKRATCEVRKSTLHLNLPTSLSSTEEISRNAVGGDDDRGRDHYSLAYLVVPNTEEQFSQPFLGLSKI